MMGRGFVNRRLTRSGAGRSRATALAVGVATLFVVGGCAGVYRPSAEPIDTSTLVVAGDWDDVVAAVEAGASWAEMAVLTREAGDGWARFGLITTDEERVTLTVERVGRGGGGDGGRVRLEAESSAGNERGPGLEASLIRGVERRLSQLSGVDVSPIR